MITVSMYSITKRSNPADEKYPYDIFLYTQGRDTLCIDTTLCELSGDYPNETTRFDLKIEGTFQNTMYYQTICVSQLTCIYTNYGYHLKSKLFDHIENYV